MKRFRGGLVCKAHRLVYHSTLGWRVIKKKEELVDAPAESETRARSLRLNRGKGEVYYIRILK